MRGEFEDSIEKGLPSTPKSKKKLTLQKAVDMGEYNPEYLSTFPEWQDLTRTMQWHYVRSGLKNRHRSLMLHWAEIFNMLDFSKKPHLAEALKNIEAQLNKLKEDEERLQVEYSK